MKIDPKLNIGGLRPGGPAAAKPGASPVERAERDAQAERAGDAERTRVSDLARRIAEARRAAESIPDVRAERVARARERLASGHYDRAEVADVVARKLLARVRESSG